MTGKFTNEARKAIDYAVRAASYHRQGYAGTEHLLTGLLKATQSAASSLLADAGVDPERLSRMIDDLVAPEGGIALDEKPGFSPRWRFGKRLLRHPLRPSGTKSFSMTSTKM